jgi:hypothetical protein
MRRTSLRFLCLLAFLTAPHLAACGGDPTVVPECEDEIDNDGDGFIDDIDPSCAIGHDIENDDPVTNCNDGEDDDGDGLIDYPEDPGCEAPIDDDELDFGTPQCDDGEDNDADGLTDYPDDPGCFSSLQNDEADHCPDGADCPECANGTDDDDDTKTDFPEDPGCTAASDNQEAAADATACAGNTFEQLPNDGLVYATLGTGNQTMLTSPSCGGTGVEKIYEFYVDDPSVMVATTNLAGTVIDTVLYVRTTCSDPSSETSCNDNADSDVQGSTITTVVQPGYYYLVVDAKTAATFGAFQMRVNFYPGVGETCDPTAQDPCAPTLVCRTLEGAEGPTCEAPVCSDTRDDDHDGTADYPGDPGCTWTTDDTEEDDCPDGPNCPQCANGVDDDLDGFTDFPEDEGCHAASQGIEGCGDEQDPINQIVAFATNGTTSGASDDQIPPSDCAFGSTVGPDVLYTVTLPVPVAQLSVRTTGDNDTVVYLADGGCDGVLACNDNDPDFLDDWWNGRFIAPDLAAGTYAIVVDTWSTSGAPFTLQVRGFVQDGAACTDPMFDAGILACQDGSICDAGICVGPACRNGDDDDGDGIADFPDDPGCIDALDNDESDTCPGTGCPVCANDLDDDNDGATDFPDDFSCVAASDESEGCETDPTLLVSMPITTGSTTTAAPDFTSACGFNTVAGNDRSFFFQLPALATSLQIDTVGSTFDTVLSLKTPACSLTDELFCDDDGGGVGNTSRLALANVAAGNYVIVVDGYNGQSGGFALNIHGIVESGAACTSPLFAAGVLACTPGQSCTSGVCQ